MQNKTIKEKNPTTSPITPYQVTPNIKKILIIASKHSINVRHNSINKTNHRLSSELQTQNATTLRKMFHIQMSNR